MKVAVYFNSGNKAIFDREKVKLLCNQLLFPPLDYLEEHEDRVVINWDNVSFMKVVEEKQDDDE